ncbi:MAG TPA: phage virion morphogenesis protein [Gammaproteobacteria bacterium]|nr:phage virion morphogenesis protein [Gammaproteobacteria bacterium]
MAGVTITVDDAQVLERLQQLLDTVTDPRPALRDAGEALLRSTRHRFDTQTAPDGHPWAPLSPATVARKKKNKDKILVLDGYLRGTLNYQVVGGTTLELGSPMIYAGTQQFGAHKGQYGSTRRGSPIPWGDIPARPFLGLSAGDKREVLAILQEHLRKGH